MFHFFHMNSLLLNTILQILPILGAVYFTFHSCVSENNESSGRLNMLNTTSSQWGDVTLQTSQGLTMETRIQRTSRNWSGYLDYNLISVTVLVVLTSYFKSILLTQVTNLILSISCVIRLNWSHWAGSMLPGERRVSIGRLHSDPVYWWISLRWIQFLISALRSVSS